MTRPASLCQLATDWGGDLPPLGAMAERKHDGWRFLWIDGKAFTRNGMPYRGIGHIERAIGLLQRQFDRPMFLDGEFVVGTSLHTLAQTKAHQDRGWKSGDAGKLWLFDAVPLDQWRSDDCEMLLWERKKALAVAIAGMRADPLSWEFGWDEGIECPIGLVADHWIADRRAAERMASEIWQAGGEGIVIKDADSHYRRNRNAAWQKYRRPIERRNAA